MKYSLKYLQNKTINKLKYILRKYSFNISFIGILICGVIMMMDVIISLSLLPLVLIGGFIVCLTIILDVILNKPYYNIN